MKKVISFPHMGNYHIPIKKLLERLTNLEVISPPPITKKTLEIGSKHSPSDACVPFKYNLGCYIESLENGANVLFQAGGGCRYRYYSEVQEKILRDLGYDFEWCNLMDGGSLNIKKVFKLFKSLNPKISVFRFIHTFLYILIFIFYMDTIDIFIRSNIGFEIKKNSFLDLNKKMLMCFRSTNSIFVLTYLFFLYKRKFKKLDINKPVDCFKVGIIGELYTAMEPFATYELEKELATQNISITRFTNLSYLLWQKRFLERRMLKVSKDYCKYSLGADGLDNVYRSILLSKKKYDGIIHTKPFACTPEVGAISIIQKVCEKEKMPIVFFSFDSGNSGEGLKTRLEAFYDLMKYRKENK